MSDVRNALERLREDVSGVDLPPAAVVRRNADRRRRRRAALALPGAATLLVAAVVLPSALFSDHGGDAVGGGDVGGSTQPPVSTAQPGPSPNRAWLPRPWSVESWQRTTLATGTAGDDFCGVAESWGQSPAVRQTLSDGTKVVRVYAIATSNGQQAANLFKEVYARCVELGPLSSEAGPAMYWNTADGAPMAARWDDSMIYLVAAEQPAGGARPPDLRAVLTDLIDTVGKPCDDSRAGLACSPATD
jgi:hypothetical protein